MVFYSLLAQAFISFWVSADTSIPLGYKCDDPRKNALLLAEFRAHRKCIDDVGLRGCIQFYGGVGDPRREYVGFLAVNKESMTKRLESQAKIIIKHPIIARSKKTRKLVGQAIVDQGELRSSPSRESSLELAKKVGELESTIEKDEMVVAQLLESGKVPNLKRLFDKLSLEEEEIAASFVGAIAVTNDTLAKQHLSQAKATIEELMNRFKRGRKSSPTGFVAKTMASGLGLSAVAQKKLDYATKWGLRGSWFLGGLKAVYDIRQEPSKIDEMIGHLLAAPGSCNDSTPGARMNIRRGRGKCMSGQNYIYEINENVKTFLEGEDDGPRSDLMASYRPLCEYYVRWIRQMRKERRAEYAKLPDLKSVRCEGDNMTLGLQKLYSSQTYNITIEKLPTKVVVTTDYGKWPHRRIKDTRHEFTSDGGEFERGCYQTTVRPVNEDCSNPSGMDMDLLLRRTFTEEVYIARRLMRSAEACCKNSSCHLRPAAKEGAPRQPARSRK